jgi:hypothetical protein
MKRRALALLASVAVLFAGSLIWASPAAAAPGRNPCSIEEWRTPGNAADCAKRAYDAAAAASGCTAAPTPGSPTSGMPGWFTSRPASSLRDGVGGQYSQYGVGGYGLDTYDLGCLGMLKHPGLAAANAMASWEFQAAASVLGAANGLREHAYDPGSMWGWSDSFLQSVTTATYRYVFTPLGGLMLAAVGLLLLWNARSGNMSQALHVAAWAILVTVAVTGIARWPVKAADGADSAASHALAAVHHWLGPGPQNLPARECLLGGEACKDNRDAATRSADVVTDAILYRSWLRAVLGDADSDTAVKYGPALYDATTLSWGEDDRAKQNPQLRQQVIDQKAATFTAIAQRIQTEDPAAYEHLQGLHDSDRTGAGAVALLSAVVFSVFDVSASLVILFAFGIFRVAILAFPLLGTVGILRPASGPLRRIMHMTTTAIVNVVVFGAGAGIYLSAVALIFHSALPGFAQVAVVALAGVGFWFVLRPMRRLVHTATGRSRTEDSLLTRGARAGRDLYAARQADPAGAGGEPGQPGPRPESRSSTTRTVAAAVAPSVVGAVDKTTGVIGEVSQHRPEGRTQVLKAAGRTAVTLIATATGGPAAGAAATAATTATKSRPETTRSPR